MPRVSKRMIPKTNALADIIWNMDELRFKQNTRMSWEAFKNVVSLIKGQAVFKNLSYNPQADVAEQLLVAMDRLGFHGNAASVHMVAQRLGVSKGTVDLYTAHVIKAILSLEKQVMRWPNMEEKEQIKTRIAETSGAKDCIDYVDGTLVGLKFKPSLNGEDYFTRKGHYSINVLIVCDDQRRIRYVMPGSPGSAQDARVFGYSKLLKTPRKYFTGRECLFADSAYPTTERIVSSYKKPLANLAENALFNLLVSKLSIR